MSIKFKSTKKYEEQELCIFYGEVCSITEISISKRNLTTLIIIGQPSITSLDGISELIHLRELWAAECRIKETKSIEKCINLEKVYLYSNKIVKIPNLVKCERLTILNLAGNQINNLKNIRGLAFLKNLNLANNNLRRILDCFPRNGRLESVNFAANPFYVLKDVMFLLGQTNLEFLVFSDPLYGDCPLVRLCHYRYHVINFLPTIKELDHYDVTDEEKQLANNFIRQKKIVYNVLWHSALNDFWEVQKRKYKEYYKEVSCVRRMLENAKFLEGKFENPNCHEISESFLKLRSQYEEIIKWEEKETDKLEIFQYQLQLKFQYSGNVDFIECANKVLQTCQLMLEDALCQFMKCAGIIGVNISRVTKLKNKGFLAFQSSSISIEESDPRFLFLVSPCGVGTMKKWPFELSESQLFSEKEIWVSDCLASADADWLQNFSSEKCTLKKSKIMLETRVCVLIQCPTSLLKKSEDSGNFQNVHMDKNKKCQQFCLVNIDNVIPTFVIEYNYQFEKEDCDNNLLSFLENNDFYFINYLQLKPNMETNLTSLNFSHQGLSEFKLTSEFANVKELDLSYNNLKTFPNVETLKELRDLNLSFNQIQCLKIREKHSKLENLNISWNNLNEFLSWIQTFELFFPNLKDLNTEFNLFEDIIQHDSRVNLAQIYLSDLKIFDGLNIEKINLKEFKSIKKSYNGSLNVFDKIIKASTVIYKINEGLKTLKANETSRRIKKLNVSGNLIRNMKFTSGFPALQELCLSNNILTQVLKIPLRNLVKLNLSSNFIQNLEGLKKDNVPFLRYLDLSNNLISSLLAMGNHELLTEFYCYQNRITDLSEIFNLKEWNELKVVDFSNNGLTGSLWRTFLLFHLPNIKYVNGELINESDIQEAKNEFSGSLNKTTLMTFKSLQDLQNIKELNIVNCSIKKVNLTVDCLPNLESLDLRKNQISNLWGLHLLLKLKTLCLSYNKLEIFNPTDSRIESNDIFPNLITLYLDHNRIRTLQTLNLEKCLKLKNLFLQHNCLQNIDGLQDSISLKTLVLDYNEIRTITMENFNSRNNIENLFLENNRIKHLCFVKNLSKLKTLLIANNQIADQDYLKVLSLCNLRQLSIFGNPLCKKTKNHYKIVLEFLENLLIVDGIEIL